MNKVLLTILTAALAALAAMSVSAAPVTTTVEGSLAPQVEFGANHSLKTSGGLPVVAYSVIDRTGDNVIYDKIKLAFCLLDCIDHPVYSSYLVANTHALGGRNKLVVAKGKPTIAWYEGVNTGTLKLARCRQNCFTPFPTYVVAATGINLNISDFDLQVFQNRPILVYGTNSIVVAYCTDHCNDADPTFFIRPATGRDVPNIKKIVLKTRNGNPVIAYETEIDFGYTKINSVNVIYCTADCYTATGQYQGGQLFRGSSPDLAIDKLGRPVISYVDQDGLKVAYCQQDCLTDHPTYQHTLVAKKATARPSLALKNGVTPYLSYGGNLAFCKGGCASAAPVYGKRALDTQLQAVLSSSLQLIDGNPVITYHAGDRDLKAIACDTPTCRL